MIEQMSYPNSLTIDTINFCNARCPFCPLFRGEAQMDRQIRPATVMSQEVYEKILRQASQWQRRPTVIQQCANAETLQDPKILDRLASLHEFGLAAITTVLTNGHFLNERIAGAILDAGVSQIMIGFDGASKEVYEAHRVRCNYDRVLGNIRNFVRLREGAKNKTAIIIKYVRTPQNEHEVRAAYRLFGELLDPQIDKFHDALSVDWSSEATKAVGTYYFNKVREGRRLERCWYLESDMMIQADGKVGACCWDYNLDSGGFGDVSESDLLDIWLGRRRNQLREAILAKSDDVPKICSDCIMRHEIEPLPRDAARLSDEFIEDRGPTSFIYRFGADSASDRAAKTPAYEDV